MLFGISSIKGKVKKPLIITDETLIKMFNLEYTKGKKVCLPFNFGKEKVEIKLFIY